MASNVEDSLQIPLSGKHRNTFRLDESRDYLVVSEVEPLSSEYL